MSDFSLAIPVILQHEGGWVNNPSDPGGETNFGISMLIIKREGITPQELGIPDLNPGSMKGMKVDAAVTIYKRLFWDKYGYGQIADQKVATKVFDCSVNCGPSRAHRMAQNAAIKCGQNITADGIFGPNTIKAINACDPKQWMQAMIAEMTNYYLAIIQANPKLAVFKNNWLHRAQWQ